ncbi:hypothetical protein LJD47_25625, partial [Escherichia coli]|nr:hypothetical protein [Escherichia coli]
KGGKANEEGGRDLLEGIQHFSPHDVRRAFATTCSDLKVRGDAISAVLDHAGIEDEIGQKVFRSAEITRLAYDYSQRLPLKREAMEAWTKKLFAECDQVWKLNRGRFRIVVPPSPPAEKLAFSESAPWYVLMEKQEERKPKPRMDLSKLKNQANLQELLEDS